MAWRNNFKNYISQVTSKLQKLKSFPYYDLIYICKFHHSTNKNHVDTGENLGLNFFLILQKDYSNLFYIVCDLTLCLFYLIFSDFLIIFIILIIYMYFSVPSNNSIIQNNVHTYFNSSSVFSSSHSSNRRYYTIDAWLYFNKAYIVLES